MKHLIILTFLLLIFAGCGDNPSPTKITTSRPNEVKEISYTVVDTLPHSTTSFTEGLLIHNNQIFESTGSPDDLPETKSVFGIVNEESGEIDVKQELNSTIYFGEGLVIVNNKIYQLTYKNQICFVYDLNTFNKIGQYRYSNQEGWGMTTDGTHIIMSDGTFKLTFRDTNNFDVVKTVPVTENGYAVEYLNELEYVNGFIYANVWPTTRIVKINPENGKVVGKMDIFGLYETAFNKYSDIKEANGIAYDSISNTLLITGKMWPEIYKIQINGN